MLDARVARIVSRGESKGFFPAFFVYTGYYRKGLITMKPREKEICSVVIDHIKDLTGRGPKNIHAKVYEDNIEVHFWLQKSPIENYVYVRHREGERIVSSLYSMALQTKFKTVEEDLNEKLGESFDLNSFEMDIKSDKYIVVYKHD